MPHSSLSIAEAIKEGERRQGLMLQKKLDSLSVLPPIDIVAVCFAASLSNPDAPMCKKSSNYRKLGTDVDVLLADYTIPMKKCVRVKVRGTAAVNAFLAKKINRGNVLRLNGLLNGTRMGNNETDAGRKRREISCQSTAYEIIWEFQQSWTSSDSGLCFAVLSCAPAASSAPGISGRRGASLELINSLTSWYCENNQNDGASILAMQPEQNCRKMALSEIIVADVFCDVLVKIRGFDKDAIIANGKYRRNHRTQLHEKTSFALLVDGEGECDMMPFHHCCRFRHLLQDAQEQGRTVHITRVLSQQFSMGDTRDIYLIPTQESTVSICEVMHRQMIVKGEESCNLSQTQAQSYSPSKTPSQEYPLSSQIFEQKVVISRIIDLFIVGKSVHLSRTIFRLVPLKLSSVLIDNCDAPSKKSTEKTDNTTYNYCRAILTLTTEKSTEDRVLIDADTMKKLCCDVEPSKLAPNADPIYKQLVCDILLGLIESGTLLTWTLEKRQTDEKWSVLDVKMISF